jgi:chromosome partitioning protein
LDLIDIQDRIATIPQGKFYAYNPIEILKRAVKPIMDEYDYILIDCPPNLGIITLNGLRIANGYIIPTIPDYMSTYGIPQIVTRIKDYASTISENIDPLGIIATKYRSQSTIHNNTIKLLKRGKDAPMFATIIPESNQIAAAAEYTKYSTLKQKWGYQGQYNLYHSLSEELMEKVD